MPHNSYSNLSDDELLILLQDNSQIAFESIYDKYWSKLYLCAYNILRDRLAAEDIVQEIMVQLWVKRASQNIKKLGPYLYQSVHFQVYKYIKRNHVHQELHELKEYAVDNEAESNLMLMEINERLEVGITSLPEKCKMVFNLSRKEHLTTKEIATLLNITPKTVENQLTIALRKIRVYMGHIISLSVYFFVF